MFIPSGGEGHVIWERDQQGCGGVGGRGMDEGFSVSYSSSCWPELWLHEYIHFSTICGMFV